MVFQHIINNVHYLSFSVDGYRGVLRGQVVTGSVPGKKAYIAICAFYSADGQMMPGPYEGWTQSQFGPFRYITGGSKDKPARFAIQVMPPAGAVRMEIGIACWDAKEMAVFAAPPQITTKWAELPPPATRTGNVAHAFPPRSLLKGPERAEKRKPRQIAFDLTPAAGYAIEMTVAISGDPSQ